MSGTSWLWGVCALLPTSAGIVVLLAGCGEEASVVDGYQPMAPALPMPSVVTPCPDGWVEISAAVGEPLGCAPWFDPPGGFPDCPGGQARFPGESGCQLVGDECPAGIWPANLPASARILYVSAAATPGGNGDLATPFDTIAAATAAATSGTVIALAKGAYDEQVLLPGGVELRGACPGATNIGSDGIAGSGIVEVVGPDAVVRNLRIGPGQRAGIVVNGQGRSATVDGVFIDRATSAGMWISNQASVTVTSLLVRSTQGDPGYGVLAQSGAEVAITRAAVERSVGSGIFVDGEPDNPLVPHVTLAAVSVHGVSQSGTGGGIGAGLTVDSGGVLDGAEIALAWAFGTSIHVSLGGRSSLSNVLVKNSSTASTAVLIESGSHLDLQRAMVFSTWHGVVAADSTMTLSDVIAPTKHDAIAAIGSSVELHRIHASGLRPYVFFDGSVVDGTDLVARGTGEFVPNGEGAISAVREAVVTIERVLIEDGAGDGLRSVTRGTIYASDVTVRRLHGIELGPVGLLCGLDAVLEVDRAHVEDITGVGAGAIFGARFRASELTVTDIRDRDCGGGVRCDGYGFGSAYDSDVEVTGFRVSNNTVAGVLVGPTSRMNATYGFIADNPIGINIQATDFDEDTLVGVEYGNNGTDVDRSDLPVPTR